MESMLVRAFEGDTKQLNRLQQKCHDVWLKVRELLTKLAKAICKEYKNLSPETEAGKFVAKLSDETFNVLKDMYFEGLGAIAQQRQHFNGLEDLVSFLDSHNISREGTDLEYYKTKNTANNDGVRNSFAGRNAKNSNQTLLQKAQSMIENGVDSETVRKETGWFKGYDGKWRFEIDDSEMKIVQTDREYLQETSSTMLGYLVNHNRLFEAYPKLKDVMVYSKDITDGDAYYDPKYQSITINTHSLNTLSDNGLKSVLIHEMQHAIQDIEGFTPGADTSDFSKYLNTAGEIEAYDVSDRLDFTINKRKNTRPDIDRESVVFADDVRLSGRITNDITDSERARILRNKTLSNLPVAKKSNLVDSWNDIDKLSGKEKRKLIQKIAREFGVFKEYIASEVELTFNFSNNNYNESYNKQKKNYQQFAKMFSVLDEVIDTSVGVEVHNRNGLYKTDPTLENVYVLFSAFEDDENVIPVKLEIKEFKDKPNSLYVAISLDAIKKTEVWKQGSTKNGVAQNSRSVTYSICDIFNKINPKDIDFIKYLPDELLTVEQLNAKQEYLKNHSQENSEAENEERKSERDTEYLNAVNNGDMETAQRMVDEEAKNAGYDVPLFHGTNEFGFTVIDTTLSDDGISFFTTTSISLAASYADTENGSVKRLNEEHKAKGLNTVEEIYSVLENSDCYYDLEYVPREWNKNKALKFTELVDKQKSNLSALDDDYNLVESISKSLKYNIVGVQTPSLERVISLADELFKGCKHLDESIINKNVYCLLSSENEGFWYDNKFHTVEEAKVEAEMFESINKGIYSLYGKSDDMFEVDAKGKSWNRINYVTPKGQIIKTTREVSRFAKNNGYKGAIIKNVIDYAEPVDEPIPQDVYVYFSSESLKSADPVTYDDSGDVIPLSKRFDVNNEDIRFSQRDYKNALSSAEWKKYNYAMISKVDAGLRISDHSILVECEDGDYSYKLVVYDNESEENNIVAIYGIGENLYNDDISNFDQKIIGEFITELEDRKYDNKQMLERLLKSYSKNVGYILGRYNNRSHRFNKYGRKVSEGSKTIRQRDIGDGVYQGNQGDEVTLYQPRPELDDLIFDKFDGEMTTNDSRLMTEYFSSGHTNVMYHLVNQTRKIDIATGRVKNIVSRLVKSYELEDENVRELTVAVLALLESRTQAETEENLQMLKGVFKKTINNSTFYSEYDKNFKAEVLDFLFVYGIFIIKKRGDNMDNMKDEDLIRVVRCENCRSFIPIDKIPTSIFGEDFASAGRNINADGYCDNISLWMRKSDYCSQVFPKKSYKSE